MLPSDADAPSSAAARSVPPQLQPLVMRYFFGTAALVALGAAAMQVVDPASRGVAPLFAAFGLLCAVAAFHGGRSIRLVAIGLVTLGLVLIGSSAFQRGWGLNAPSMGVLALATCLVTALAGLRMGLATAAAAVAMLLGLGYLELAGELRGAGVVGEVPLWRRLGTQLLLLATGVGTGYALARLLGHHLRRIEERESRFVRLLGIASDAYWEMDEECRITHIATRDRHGRFVARRVRKPFQPWERREVRYDEDVLDEHRADLEARVSFRDVRMDWQGRDGDLRHLLVSGEPRFDQTGLFRGYWGVWRDITQELRDRDAAAEALRRSEQLLSHLFSTSPELIALTEFDSGRYAMVNGAFQRVTGWTADEVIGRTSLELGVWETAEERDAFLAELHSRGSVKDRPTVFVGRYGQRMSLLVSAARFSVEEREYLVINAHDVTATERTRLEHEAMLSNASLGIAFTRDQRFVQANRALEQMLGWGPGELIGQSGRVIWNGEDEYREIGAQIGPTLARGESADVERELTRRDGSRLWCRVLTKAIDPTHPLKGGTLWIVEDFSERRRFEQALARARDEAEAANRAKSAFLANTSHEIRTPLNGLVGLAHLARQPQLDEARRRQYLDQIGDSAETLSALISDILDLSKIEAGRLHVETRPFDLRSLLRALQRAYGALADARGLGFELQLDERLPPWVSGDPMRLRQVLSNYLANALKFTRQGGIRMVARAGGGEDVRFEVHDTGPGVEPAILPRLFHPFTQADQSTTRRYGGTGLGLSICRELAVLMGGQVGAQSRVGEGSCFWVALPLPRADAPEPESGFGALEETNPLADARVLLVEDNPVNMMIAAAMLEQWGVRVAQASDGAAAVDAALRAAKEQRGFDAVLMDVQMPVMGGHEAARRLHAEPATRELPVIALTAAALVSEREQALAAGMVEFLTKPIDPQRLRATLLRVLGRRR